MLQTHRGTGLNNKVISVQCLKDWQPSKDIIIGIQYGEPSICQINKIGKRGYLWRIYLSKRKRRKTTIKLQSSCSFLVELLYSCN